MSQRPATIQSRTGDAAEAQRRDLRPYRYSAYSPSNSITGGVIMASSLSDAEDSLARAGYRPLWVRPARQGLSLPKVLRSKRVKPQDPLTLAEQLSVLLHAGVPLVTALESMQGQFRNPEFTEAFAAITEEVRGGTPLSKAMEKYPHIFSGLYVSLIALGERSGDMEGMLEQIRVYFGRELAVRKKTQRALTYPAIVIGLAVVVSIMMVLLVLPKIVLMFEAFSVPLPLLTRIVLGAGGFITRNQLLLLVVFLVLGMLGFLVYRQPPVKRWLHQAMLRLPLLKTMIVYRELGRFSRLSSLMLHNGLTLTEILGLTAGTAGNLEVKEALQAAQADVTSGRTLSSSLERASFVPPMFLLMIRTGEISGNLEDNLNSISNFYERELDATIESALAMLEPALTIAIGAVVGLVAVSVIMPIYSLVGTVGGQQ